MVLRFLISGCGMVGGVYRLVDTNDLCGPLKPHLDKKARASMPALVASPVIAATCWYVGSDTVPAAITPSIDVC